MLFEQKNMTSLLSDQSSLIFVLGKATVVIPHHEYFLWLAIYYHIFYVSGIKE